MSIPRNMLAEVPMKLRFGTVSLLLTLSLAFAGDGLVPRGSAGDYQAHEVSGDIAIGATYVPSARAKKIFADNLDQHGYLVFEVGIFPADGIQSAISADNFRLRQGATGSIVRPTAPHSIAAAVHPQKPTNPKIPGKVNVETVETVGYERGPNGQHGVYTGTEVGVGAGTPSVAPPLPPQPDGNTQASLEQRLDERSLPEGKTSKAVAGYLYFPKPTGDKHTDFELIYLGRDGQMTLKLSPTGK